MRDVLLDRSTDPAFDLPTLNGMFQFRHRVFHDLLGWAVNSERGMERDEYDDLNPVYLIAKNAVGDIEGNSRLLPTTGPSMLHGPRTDDGPAAGKP